MNYDVSDQGEHTKIVVDNDNLIDSKVILGQARSNIAPLLYEGTGLLADTENPLVLSLVSGHSTSYSYIPGQKIKEVVIWISFQS